MEINRKCDNCGKEYEADTRNLNRGWGLCCSKSWAARKREQSKPGYDAKVVSNNNIRRANWHRGKLGDEKIYNYYDPGDSEYWNNKDF